MVVDICKSKNLGSKRFVGIETLVLWYEIYSGNFKIPDRFGFFGRNLALDPYKFFIGREFPDK